MIHLIHKGLSMKEKEIHIINTILEAPEALTLTEIIGRTDLPKTTVHRTLNNLISEKVLYKLDAKYYAGSVLLKWLNSKQHKEDYVKILHPYLQRLADEVGETVHLVKSLRNKAIYVDKVSCEGPVQLKSQVGTELELYSTGAGRALLMMQEETAIKEYLENTSIIQHTQSTVTDKKELLETIEKSKGRGFSLEVEQNENGIHCIGAPLRVGDLELAISITATLLTPSEKLICNHSKKLIESVETIQREVHI